MRISDWSSDVCSSDLVVPPRGRAVRGGDAACLKGVSTDAPQNVATGRAIPPNDVFLRRQEREKSGQPERHMRHESRDPLQPDRKSVVEGKSGSVRVDLGGRSIIKKNKFIFEMRVIITVNIT